MSYCNYWFLIIIAILCPIDSMSSQVDVTKFWFSGESTYIELGASREVSIKVKTISRYVDVKNKTEGALHWSVKYETCLDNQEFFCFYGSGINIALPKNRSPWPNSWSVGDYDYTYLGEKPIKVFGNVLDVAVILDKKTPFLKAEEDYTVYYYSADNGLVAFSMYFSEDKLSETYYSEHLPSVKLDDLELISK